MKIPEIKTILETAPDGSRLVSKPPAQSFFKLMSEDDGARLLWSAFEQYKEQIRNRLESLYMENNRDGAVWAGRLAGLRMAFEILPGLVLEAQKKPQTPEPQNPTPPDDGY